MTLETKVHASKIHACKVHASKVHACSLLVVLHFVILVSVNPHIRNYEFFAAAGFVPPSIHNATFGVISSMAHKAQVCDCRFFASLSPPAPAFLTLQVGFINFITYKYTVHKPLSLVAANFQQL